MNPLVLMSGLAPGGAERVTVSFLRRLNDQGRRVPLCTLTAAHDDPSLVRELEEAGVERLDLGARRLADPAALLRLRALLRAREVDLVHAHGQDATILSRWAAWLTGFRRVDTRHVVEEPGGTWRERARARGRCGRCAAPTPWWRCPAAPPNVSSRRGCRKPGSG